MKPQPYDWDAAGYRDCPRCHGGFPAEHMTGDLCKWCSAREDKEDTK